MAELEFEKPILELERKIADLKKFSFEKNINLSDEIDTFEQKLEQLKKEIYGNLTAWQKVQISRHTDRPTTLDYVEMIMRNFIELHGDRIFGDDKALITGLCWSSEREKYQGESGQKLRLRPSGRIQEGDEVV